MKNNMRLRLCHPAREICLLATIALLTPFTAFPQATDHTDELTRLLLENKFFPACRYYQTHHDSLRLEWQADSSVQEMETPSISKKCASRGNDKNTAPPYGWNKLTPEKSHTAPF